jgi:hypothetical protein
MADGVENSGHAGRAEYNDAGECPSLAVPLRNFVNA